MPAESEEIVKRLLDGPEGNGWTCDFASEMDLISEAALEIRGLSREVDRLREALVLAHRALTALPMQAFSTEHARRRRAVAIDAVKAALSDSSGGEG